MLFTLRRALRSVAQTPLATGVIVLCIGLGVGPTTTVFTWTEHLVRRPLPAVRSFDRLVSIVTRADGREESVSYPDYVDWRDSVRGVSALAAFGIGQFGLRAAAEPPDASEGTWGVLVTDNYFDVLGVRAVAGRTFLTGESSTQGEAPYVVVSHALARRRFGGDASAIGRGIRINGVPFTVVGVTPASFNGTFAGLSFDFWVPVTMHPLLGGDANALTGRDRRWLQTIGRLRDGASLAEARTELQAISVGLAGTYRENERREAFVKPLDTGAARRLETLFAVLLGVTTFVAVIVCTNVANLLLLRGAGRRYEIGMLLALGASRRQIVCQLLTEAALLAALGGGVGLVLARWCQTLLPALMPSSPLPLALTAESDLRTGLFALVLSAAMVSVFGLLPAISAVRGAVLPNLRTARGGMTRSSTRLRAALVKVQIGLSLAALASAGAFLRVNSSLAAIDRGLRQPQEVLLVSTDLDQAGYHTPQERRTAAERLLGRVRALPDTHAAALATFVPLGFTGYTTVRASVPAYVPKTGESMAVLANYVSSDYFTTLGIPLLDGRGIDDRDTDASAPVVVVNAAFVQRYLQNLAVIGSRVDLGTRTLTVIGVAADGKYRFDALDQPSPPLVYFAYAQASRASLTLHVRTKGPPQSLVPQIRQAFADVHPSLPLNSPTTLDEYTSLPLFPVRLGTAVLSSLGGIALLLACAGLYGVVAFRVTQRWNELAVRLALGATPSSLMRLIVGDGLRNAAGGLALGVILAIVAIRMIASRLPRVQAVDPAVLLGATGLLGTVALLAAVLPALRAWWVNPASVLRGE